MKCLGHLMYMTGIILVSQHVDLGFNVSLWCVQELEKVKRDNDELSHVSG